MGTSGAVGAGVIGRSAGGGRRDTAGGAMASVAARPAVDRMVASLRCAASTAVCARAPCDGNVRRLRLQRCSGARNARRRGRAPQSAPTPSGTTRANHHSRHTTCLSSHAAPPTTRFSSRKAHRGRAPAAPL
eukprot:3537144-Prymnesium_polylepis.1